MDFTRFSSKKSIAAGVLAFAAVGTLLLVSSHAATPTASFEAENGTIAGGVAAFTDTTASGGSAVKFQTAASGPQSCPAYPAFPDANCTGVPAGTTLSNSTECTITTGGTSTSYRVIDAKTFNCDVTVNANYVRITRSQINGMVDSGSSAAFEIQDSSIDGSPNGPEQNTTLGSQNFKLLRVDLYGGSRTVLCEHNCEVRDSWLHDQENITGSACSANGNIKPCLTAPPDDWHLSAIRLSQNSTIIHNTISCNVPVNSVDGGCSANQTGYPDFEPTHHWHVEKNLFKAAPNAAYCSYGAGTGGKQYSGNAQNATYIEYIDNVYERGANNKCAAYGPITDFISGRTGNVWTNNKWSDGTLLLPD